MMLTNWFLRTGIIEKGISLLMSLSEDSEMYTRLYGKSRSDGGELHYLHSLFDFPWEEFKQSSWDWIGLNSEEVVKTALLLYLSTFTVKIPNWQNHMCFDVIITFYVFVWTFYYIVENSVMFAVRKTAEGVALYFTCRLNISTLFYYN